MKTKNKVLFIFTVILIAGFISFISSCNKDNLELTPGFETEGMKFKVEDDFNKGIFGVYQNLTNLYWFNKNTPIHALWLLPGDDMTTQGASPFDWFAGLSSGNGSLNEYWKQAYMLINRANTMIEKIKAEDGKVIKTDGLKNSIHGEALFLRALMYFNIWNFWGGGAPLVMKRLTAIGESSTPSAGGTVMLDSVIVDLQKAATLLPPSWDAKYRGRVTKDGAYGLLGKALVFRGDYNNSTADYTAAITAINSLSSSRQLTTQFNDNFKVTTENNSESLFEVQATSAPDWDHIWLDTDWSVNNGNMSVYWAFFYPYNANATIPETGAAVSFNSWTYWAAIGGYAITASPKLYAAYDATDPRRAETCQIYSGGNASSYNGYFFVKYVLRGQEGVFTTSLNNPRVLRLADCLLLKAEAIVKSGGSLTDAVTLINQIRARARGSVPTSAAPANRPAAASAAQALQWIREERLLELAGEEGHRWFDLKRWHKHGDIDLSTWGSGNTGFSISNPTGFGFSTWFTNTQGEMLYPLPTSETEANKKITQNKGY